MEYLLIILIILNSCLSIFFIFAYHDYRADRILLDSNTTKINDSFTDVASVVESLSKSQSTLYRDFITISDDQKVIMTILGIHSEALNTKLLMELFSEKPDGTGTLTSATEV